MPLEGTICCRTGQPTGFDECLTNCRQRDCVYPLPLLMSMSRNGYKRANAAMSATTILQCPRQSCLKETVGYFEPPSEYFARWRGTGVHAMAEADGPYPGVIQERRIRKIITIDTDMGDLQVEVTGQPDWWDTNNLHLDDWKSTGVCPTEPRDDHIAQVNIYAWLIDGGAWDDTGEVSTGQVETASIVYFDPKRSVSLPVTLWSNEATFNFIHRRIAPIVFFKLSGELPSPSLLTKKDSWRKRFCPFSGSGLCCGDNEERLQGNQPLDKDSDSASNGSHHDYNENKPANGKADSIERTKSIPGVSHLNSLTSLDTSDVPTLDDVLREWG